MITGKVCFPGRVRATRSTRARELLTELTPALLSALITLDRNSDR